MLDPPVAALAAGYALLAACSQQSDLPRFHSVATFTAVRGENAGPMHYRVLHDFGNGSDASRPTYLLAIGAVFYGTSESGGTEHGGAYGSCGTFYSITTTGTENVLHNFGAKGDGCYPSGTLIDAGGTLYGTTQSGGAHGEGTVFSVTPSGKERVIYSFGVRPDGESPSAGLIDEGGILYGTTFGGGIGCGPEGCGTVFSIANGREKILYQFNDATSTEGWYPDAGLQDIAGVLYGTTLDGGYGQPAGWGTFFSVTTSGKEKLLYRFGRGNGGWYPSGNLLRIGSAFYGTTVGGGSHDCAVFNTGGCGTVFSITTDGKERVIHSFDGADGSQPQSSLTNIRGLLYGTTVSGGAYSCGPYHGCGTAFSVTTGGSETVLHSFRMTTGYLPASNLIYKNGSLYGTAQLGGRYGSGPPYNGGVFYSLTP